MTWGNLLIQEMRSMTSFGQGTVDVPLGRIFVEIHTVNKKNLEISCFMAKELKRFEQTVRTIVAKAISCGYVTVHVRAVFHKDAPVRLAAHIPFAEQLKREYEKIGEALGLRETVSLSLLGAHKELFAEEENQLLLDQLEPLLEQATTQALENCRLMKKREGDALRADFQARLQLLQEQTELIQTLAKDEPHHYREKLKSLLERLETSLDEERMAREILLFAEKIDISEELTRLLSHFEQASHLLQSEEAVGKTLDFLSQEIQREVNTIASKSQNLAITRAVIVMKTEVARIREQVMNVE